MPTDDARLLGNTDARGEEWVFQTTTHLLNCSRWTGPGGGQCRMAGNLGSMEGMGGFYAS